MSQIVHINHSSLHAQGSLSANNSDFTRSIQRLSSGLRVASTKDHVAGIAIEERLQWQIKGMSIPIRNANDGTSLATPSSSTAQSR